MKIMKKKLVHACLLWVVLRLAHKNIPRTGGKLSRISSRIERCYTPTLAVTIRSLLAAFPYWAYQIWHNRYVSLCVLFSI
jgi:hypothetical protein